jgi:hypothetical protein
VFPKRLRSKNRKEEGGKRKDRVNGRKSET